MKVIICGAGLIGMGIAKYLSREETDIVVVDASEELLRDISDSLDVQTVHGSPSHPDVLEKAGAKEAHLIIAVTPHDEINIVACQIAHSLFEVPLKISYIKDHAYFNPEWADLFSPTNIPINVLISPEREIARTISRTIQVPGAFNVIPLIEDKINVIGVRCSAHCSATFIPLRQLTNLFPDLNIMVLAILRADKLILTNPEEQMLPGDDIYFIAEKSHVMRAMQVFGCEKPTSRNVLILGGGNIGIMIARELENIVLDMTIKLIEINRTQATLAAGQLEKSIVLCGDALDTQILSEANIAHTESLIAVTNDNEVNILASLLGKRNGASQAITLINNPTYSALVTPLGIDAVISPRDITISSILHYVRRGRVRSVYTLREGIGELMEAEVLENSSMIGCPIHSINDPKKFIIGAVVRDGQVIIAYDSLILKMGDLVVLFAKSSAVHEAEKLFSNKGDYL